MGCVTVVERRRASVVVEVMMAPISLSSPESAGAVIKRQSARQLDNNVLSFYSMIYVAS